MRISSLLILLMCAASTLGAQPAYDDITFFVGSDLHYGGSGGNLVCADVSRGVLDRMNHLPGTPYPASIGGVVDTPRGVLLLGDITEEKPYAWAAFTNDWGLVGERSLHFPVYEGFGNHDCLDPTVPNRIKERNPFRPHLSNISSNGYHYSWDWDSVHFVCLNLFPANEVDNQHPPHDPKNSLDFLIQDLATKVGDSGRPVITCHHYGLDKGNSDLWWTDEQREKYFQALRKYNLIYVLAGHTHNPFFTVWRGIDTCNDGTIGRFSGNFMVGHITHTNFTLILRQPNNAWDMVFTKSFTNGMAIPSEAKKDSH